MEKEIYKLYHRPSFWEGMARLFDFGGILNKYNYSHSGNEADYRAIQSDWNAVGTDLDDAISRFGDEVISRFEREQAIESHGD